MKPKVLILTDWFFPGYKAGGPIQSVYNLVKATNDEVDYVVITGDRDLNSDVRYEIEKFDEPLKLEMCTVLYTTTSNRAKIIGGHLKDSSYKKIYMNSLYSLDFSLLPIFKLLLLGKLSKVLLAPRGMLGEGALKIKSVKKRCFIQAFKSFGLHKKISFHSTDKTESKAIFNVFGREIGLHEIGNIPATFEYLPKFERAEKCSFVFASRVSPKKNLYGALKAIGAASVDCFVSVFGEIEDLDYKKKCDQVKLNRIDYYGSIPPTQLHQEIRKHDFFILPTLNENFGHSIIEALSLGVPVLISDQTPWIDLEEFGAGWVIPLKSEDRWIEIIQEASQISNEDYSKMSNKAIRYVSSKIDIDVICRDYITMFNGK